MRLYKSLLLLPLFGATAYLAASEVTIKKTPISRTNAASGQEMFMTYCASCHGRDAKGNGPAAPALKIPPSDLTTLASRHDGKFPDMKVGAILRGQEDLSAHGSKDMPVWGPILASQGTATAELDLRLANLTRYLKSLQR